MVSVVSRSERRRIIPITELEQSAFCQTDGNLRTRTLEDEFNAGVRWQKVPTRYLRMTPDQVEDGIRYARKELGTKVTVLGHHYQRDDVIQFADFRGDSYLLSKQAAATEQAKWIVFCGVHFMAETADILTATDQHVILPNMAAGCSMADMAPTEDVDDAWEDLAEVLGTTDSDGKQEIVPVAYMNSTAAIKALCGRNGGLICTSSNADKAFEWAFERGKRILFLPDQHLGRNTGLASGIPADAMVVWNPFKPLGGLSEQAIRDAKVILWQGHCSVHTRFTVQQIVEARREYPDVQVMVHPECTREVVEAADCNGSTEFIRTTVENSPPGATWAIGTEISMVNRLRDQNPDKTIFCLDPVVCPCATMYRIHPAYVLWVLEGIMAGVGINVVSVDDATRRDAVVAIDRMLEIAG